MKLAYSTLACPRMPLEDALAIGTHAGYEGVELRLIDGDLIDPHLPERERRRVRRAAEDAGLVVAAVDSSIRVADPAPPDTLVREIEAFVDLAADWGAGVVRVFGGSLPDDPKARQERLGAAAEVLSEAAARAAERSVRIGLETHDSFLAAATVADVLRRVPSPAVGAVWDSHHPFRAGETAEAVDQSIGARVVLAQVKDARRTPGRPEEWELVPLGEGEVPVRRMLELLHARRYQGWVSVEWERHWHPELAEPQIALPAHIALLRKWLEDIEAGDSGGGQPAVTRPAGGSPTQ